MRQLSLIIVCLALIGAPFVTAAEEDYEPEDLPALAGEFALSYDLLDENNAPLYGSVSGIATIKIMGEGRRRKKPYTLTLYLDRSYILEKENITLPYDFKWNFTGLSNGAHELMFVLRDRRGEKGILRLDIEVQH